MGLNMQNEKDLFLQSNASTILTFVVFISTSPFSLLRIRQALAGRYLNLRVVSGIIHLT